ncbi:MAG TPA: DUF2845 domain-containing protein [Gammaproteobacteria bacterium]|nr:DUF2845 domain-containing protein [Gammaproteobacteria bacterium]
MNIKWIICPGSILLMLIMSPAFAWRCDHGLVNTGDSTSEVRKKCGQPDYVYSDTGVYRRGRFTSIDEHWYYNYGPSRFLQALRFHKGVLQAVDTLGYGFRPVSHRCTPQDIRVGMSAYELAIRCGKPKSKRNRLTRIGGGKHSGGEVVSHKEEWTYDFGSQYLLQKVTISSGHVQGLETASRAKHPAKRSR